MYWGPLAGGRDQNSVRPGYPVYLLRSYHGYSINNRWQTFISSHCAVNTDIEQQTIFFFKVLLFALFALKTTFFYRSTRTMIVLVVCLALSVDVFAYYVHYCVQHFPKKEEVACCKIPSNKGSDEMKFICFKVNWKRKRKTCKFQDWLFFFMLWGSSKIVKECGVHE